MELPEVLFCSRAQNILRPTNTNRRNWFTRKKCIYEKKWVFKSAIKQMCLVRSIDIHPTLREAWYEEVSVTSLLCSPGILGHHLLQPHCRNKEWAVQYTSKIKAIHSLLIGEMFVRWASVWSEVQILQICWMWWGHKIFVFLLQRVRVRMLWFLIQKMEFLFCCAVLWWIRASWRYLHIWPRSIFHN